MDLPEDIRAALQRQVGDQLGMTIEDVLTLLAMLNGAQLFDDVPPATMAYWLAFFIELNRRILIIKDALQQLLDTKIGHT